MGGGCFEKKTDLREKMGVILTYVVDVEKRDSGGYRFVMDPDKWRRNHKYEPERREKNDRT